eukprot:CAMPEP_0183358226 /NCGR_PEP_ID=MMETSP0164_2-20130417/48545_1 /TAXON_ID=221442 /ORGANISM="Coccolithus pelagicus ssp braarudi, Strain PLY182g" /LENGTH=83 /DNA_ID=CAMNT_0025532077 /DNA_START=337 /DNA_END=586 /DNA_ORIENTATION=-
MCGAHATVAQLMEGIALETAMRPPASNSRPWELMASQDVCGTSHLCDVLFLPSPSHVRNKVERVYYESVCKNVCGAYVIGDLA